MFKIVGFLLGLSQLLNHPNNQSLQFPTSKQLPPRAIIQKMDFNIFASNSNLRIFIPLIEKQTNTTTGQFRVARV